MTRLVITVLTLLPFTAAAAPVQIPCRSGVEEWVKTAASAQPTTKTCQVLITKSTDKGACGKEKTEQVTNSAGYTYWETICLQWKSIGWTKAATVTCGGFVLLNARQSCAAANTDEDGAEKAFAAYDHAVGSVFIEQMAQQGFHMARSADYSNGTRIYFER